MTVVTEEVEFISLSEAAAKLSTTETRILMLLKRKALEGMLTDEGWLVGAASLASYDSNETEPENPLSCRTSCTSSKCGCH